MLTEELLKDGQAGGDPLQPGPAPSLQPQRGLWTEQWSQEQAGWVGFCQLALWSHQSSDTEASHRWRVALNSGQPLSHQG